MSGSVNKIETFGLVDGPGIRTVVFLNGCKLRCKYCHNPEIWNMKDKNMSVLDVVNKVLRSKPYFKRNNGGVTFSGGEPLIQGEFLLECLKKLKENNIHTAIDTSGVGVGNYLEILKYTDLVLLDIKHVDREKYEELTGQAMDEFNKFVQDLNKSCVKVWIRQVIIPGYNDNLEYLRLLKEYLKQIKNIERIDFLPYHTLGREKYKSLGISYPFEDVPAMDKTRCQELYEKFINL